MAINTHEVLAPYLIWTHSVEDIGRIACEEYDVKRVGIVGEVRRTRFGWVRWQSDAEVVCWAVVRTCRRLVSAGRIYRVAWNEVKVPLSVVERSVCASPVAVARVCNTSAGRIEGLIDFRQCVLRPPYGKSDGTDKGKRILSVQQKTEVLKRNGTTTDI